MDLVTPALNDVRITTQPDNTHHLILIAPSDMRADALHNGLGNNVGLSYIEKDDPTLFYLSVEIIDTQKYFTVEIVKNNETGNWLGWIDEGTVTHLWVGYLDGKGEVSIYGPPIRLVP